jgi:hypothetical protein
MNAALRTRLRRGYGVGTSEAATADYFAAAVSALLSRALRRLAAFL